MGFSTIKITCAQPTLIALKSDHLQNVVSRIFIFGRNNVDRMRHVENFGFNHMWREISQSDSEGLILITPMTGIEVVAAVNSILFFESRQ